jgi:hypothetical protein
MRYFKKWFGQFWGDFFNNLIWSPCWEATEAGRMPSFFAAPLTHRQSDQICFGGKQNKLYSDIGKHFYL